MHPSKSCSRGSCTRRVVASLGAEDFCFDHFCSRCYERLERADRGLSAAAELPVLEECTLRALEISLSELPLNNLDRARLLDILLWSGDLTNQLRRKQRARLGAAVAASSADR